MGHKCFACSFLVCHTLEIYYQYYLCQYVAFFNYSKPFHCWSWWYTIVVGSTCVTICSFRVNLFTTNTFQLLPCQTAQLFVMLLLLNYHYVIPSYMHVNIALCWFCSSVVLCREVVYLYYMYMVVCHATISVFLHAPMPTYSCTYIMHYHMCMFVHATPK